MALPAIALVITIKKLPLTENTSKVNDTYFLFWGIIKRTFEPGSFMTEREERSTN
jgi:hypothetical protein